jgi:CheY-like chemotaxis protein
MPRPAIATVRARTLRLAIGPADGVALPLRRRAGRRLLRCRTDGRPRNAALAAATVNAMTRHSILVVDDSRDAADTLALALELLGCEVARAYDAAAALELLKTFRPTLMVLDLSMPVMDGYALGRLIRQQPALASVPMVALSGFGRDSDRQRSREAGFDRHLLKPIEFERLQQLLDEYPVG